MPMREKIEKKLKTALDPQSLEVIDESHLHQGHSGSKSSGETHYFVRIGSAVFKNMNRIQQHRKVYEVLERELQSGVHALRIEVIAEA
ncbi:BolA family transcriptional regulator [Candidatus Bealeia paramacronuclearis]|uniref:BolA family transcriptional regulator n=2 Tax=Candidatus Bealeia paramacronuclearis TaxID=1921001 RepID=A0ABZ2C4K3_9PROT|nr:BolA family transcriptional regulator [Candidatus Bealeia paramacronuclearis]